MPDRRRIRVLETEVRAQRQPEAMPGSDQLGSEARTEVARDRAQSPIHTVAVKAVAVGEVALGKKQKTGPAAECNTDRYSVGVCGAQTPKRNRQPQCLEAKRTELEVGIWSNASNATST